jgi:hypothetical protein
MKPSPSQLFRSCRDDLLSDARQAEAQAKAGPFYPGVTKESLLAYAGECRADAAQMTGAKEDEYVTECVRHTLRSASPCPLPFEMVRPRSCGRIGPPREAAA